MDKGCFLLLLDDTHMTLEMGPVAYPPEIHTEDILISDNGDLPRGLYKYAVTSLGVNGESSYINEVIVNAYHKQNAVVLSWKPIPHISEYRIYRGSENRFDGYFTMYTRDGYFCDDGTGVLNEFHKIPPERTISVLNPIRKIHKSSVLRFSAICISGTTYLSIVLTSGEEISLDFSLLVDRPYWTSKGSLSTQNALRSLEEWKCL